MQIIPLSAVLQIMATTTQPFNLVVVTADRKRGTGGELLELEGCLQSGVKIPKRGTGWPTAMDRAIQYNNERQSKAPDHYHNQTRNVVIQSSQQQRKIHIRLILSFNGKLVRW